MPAPPNPRARRSPLIRAADPAGAGRDRRRFLPFLALGMAALLAAALVGWGAFAGSEDTEEAAGLVGTGAVELAAPIDGPDRWDGAWARLRIAPARTGTNTVVLRATDGEGTPVPAGAAPPLAVTVAGLDDPAAALPVDVAADGNGVFTGEATLNATGWWRAEVTAADAGSPAPLPFYLLLPDPNLHGTDAPGLPESDPAAQAVFERGRAALTALHRVRYRESLGDGQGHLAFAEWAVSDGTDGAPAASSYRAPGGTEAIVVGDRRWLRRPGTGWETGAAAPVVPPADWGGDYAAATGFRLGGEETVDGEPCRIVTFAVPEQTEPRRLAAAWYAWWVGTESGQIRREAMVSRNHYMLHEYADFDAPLAIAPPADAPAAASATATPIASPGP